MTRRPPIAYPISPAGARRAPIRYRTATVVVRHNGVGRWSLVAPLSAVDLDVFDGGWRVAWDGQPVDGLGGYIDRAKLTVDRDTGTPMATLSGPDDMTVLAERLAYPNPLVNSAAQGTPAYDIRTGVASTVILQYIRYNAGDLALTPRQTANFVSNITDPAIGGTASGRARFDPLLDVVAPLAEQAGLAITVTSTTAGVRTLGIAAVVDRTASARFSIALRNLQSLTYELQAPPATFVVAGGRGEETTRMFRPATNSAGVADWRWRETFHDARSASDTDGGTELTAAATKRLSEVGPVETVDLVPLDTDRLTYGVDYRLGDKVLGEVGYGTGLKVPAVIREVEITVDRAIRRPLVHVQPRASTLPTTGRLKTDRELRALAERLGRLERR
ncbi:Gp37-like protein [Saccharothrix stipae]